MHAYVGGFSKIDRRQDNDIDTRCCVLSRITLVDASGGGCFYGGVCAPDFLHEPRQFVRLQFVHLDDVNSGTRNAQCLTGSLGLDYDLSLRRPGAEVRDALQERVESSRKTV